MHTSRWLKALLALAMAVASLVVVCILAIHQRSLDNYFVADDWEHIRMVTAVRSPADVVDLLGPYKPQHYRPLHWLLTLALYRMAGLNPVPFHAVSILLDAGNAVLLGLLMWRLQQALLRRRSQAAAVAALGVAVLFLANPRHHDAVYWYGAINEVLSVFFRLLTLHLLLSWLRSGGQRKSYYLLGLLAAVLALASKESAAALPVDLLLLFVAHEYCTGARRWRIILAVVPFALLATGWIAV